MKKVLFIIFGVLSAGGAIAKAPDKKFQQLLEQLQKAPADAELRGKVMMAAVKAKPTVPDAALEAEGRAKYAFTNAKSTEDYLAAAREYEKAVTAAPWVTGYYSDLCTIYEKAGKLGDAIRNCETSLSGLTDSAKIADLKRRIGGLKYGLEQLNSPAVVAKKEKESAEDLQRKFLSGLEAGVWNAPLGADNYGNFVAYDRLSITIRNGRLILRRARWGAPGHSTEPAATEYGSVALTGNRVKILPTDILDPACGEVTMQISSDGESIHELGSCYSNPFDKNFSRAR